MALFHLPLMPGLSIIYRLRLVLAPAALALAGCSSPGTSGVVVPVWASDSATVRVAAGPQYNRGAVWRFFFGTHYRALWATPVTVPVLRLATAVPGGLTPVQAGGSFQSRTLRLRTTAGHQYVLRSVDKDMGAALPVRWRWLLGGLMKDQTCVSEPYGAYVAAVLAEAAGVYHANPRLVYLPADPALGKFRSAYANALYLLEERPEGNQQEGLTFGHAAAVVNSRHLLTMLRQWPTHQVDGRAYLRARLLDMWLGDWSRREDQWRWASFPQAGRTGYRPIPRDRDQAFFLFDDGTVPTLASWFIPKFQSFHGRLQKANVAGLAATARALDRTLLAGLSAEDFRQEADSLRRRLTNAVIARALARGPAQTRAPIAAQLESLLRERRAQLPAVARWYYELLAAEAWLVGTEQAERFVVGAAGPGRVRVRMLAIRLGVPDSLLAQRIYASSDTRQLDLFGLGGNDIFEISKDSAPNFYVNIYAGAGQNQVNWVDAPAQTEILQPRNFTWYRGPEREARPPAANINVRVDEHPELSANAAGWLQRYMLRD